MRVETFRARGTLHPRRTETMSDKQTAPTLDAIDARLDAAIKKPGPHVFAQR